MSMVSGGLGRGVTRVTSTTAGGVGGAVVIGSFMVALLDGAAPEGRSGPPGRTVRDALDGAVVALDLRAVGALVAADPDALALAGGGRLFAVGSGVLVRARPGPAPDRDARPLVLPRSPLGRWHRRLLSRVVNNE